MKKTIFSIILVINAFLASGQYTIRFAYDNENQISGYKFAELFTRSYVYDLSGNRIIKNQQTPDFTNTEFTSEKGRITVYPNPVKGNRLYVTGLPENGPARVNLFNLNGTAIQADFNDYSGLISLPGNLPPGLYFLIIENKDKKSHHKIIKL